MGVRLAMESMEKALLLTPDAREASELHSQLQQYLESNEDIEWMALDHEEATVEKDCSRTQSIHGEWKDGGRTYGEDVRKVMNKTNKTEECAFKKRLDISFSLSDNDCSEKKTKRKREKTAEDSQIDFRLTSTDESDNEPKMSKSEREPRYTDVGEMAQKRKLRQVNTLEKHLKKKTKLKRGGGKKKKKKKKKK